MARSSSVEAGALQDLGPLFDPKLTPQSLKSAAGFRRRTRSALSAAGVFRGLFRNGASGHLKVGEAYILCSCRAPSQTSEIVTCVKNPDLGFSHTKPQNPADEAFLGAWEVGC